MKLVIIGNETLDDLASLAQSYFSQIKNTKIQKPDLSEEVKPFLKHDLGKLIKFQRANEFGPSDIAVLISIPSLLNYTDSAPLSYI